jgi:hypothetical protein
MGIWGVVSGLLVAVLNRSRLPSFLFFAFLAALAQISLAGALGDSRFLIRGAVDDRGVENLPDAKALVGRWFDQHKPADGTGPVPAIVVLAEGGGVYAALNAAVTLAELDRRSEGKFFSNVFVLSGVSGGSLGVATYLAGRSDGVQVSRRTRIAATFLAKDYLSPIVSGMLFVDTPVAVLPGVSFFPGLTDRAALFEDALKDEWRTAAGANAFARPFVDVVRDASDSKQASSPLVFFGTASIRGRLAVVSNVKLDEAGATRASAIRNVLDGSLRVPALATAAHISSRFPYLSPSAVVPLATDRPREDRERYLDGGYVDNTGSIVARRAVDLLFEKAGQSKVEIIVIHLFDRTFASKGSDNLSEPDESLVPILAANASRTMQGYVALESLCRTISPDATAAQHCAEALSRARTLDIEAPALRTRCGTMSSDADRDEIVRTAGGQTRWLSAPLDIGFPGTPCFVPLGWYVGNAQEYVVSEATRRSAKVYDVLCQHFADRGWPCPAKQAETDSRISSADRAASPTRR